ncbi:MAG: response regulator, partial [Treponema sp.]|nr:response regulator [Treponema sp.]
MRMINVLSIDDHEMISFGLEKVFSETKDIRLYKSCKSIKELEDFLASLSPEISGSLLAMVDIKLCDESGFDCGDFLVAKGIKCMMYSSYSNAGFIVKSMEHKIKGFVTKNADKKEILEAVRAVAR